MRTVLAAVSSLALLAACAQVVPSSQAREQLVSRGGTLRVAVLYSDPVIAVRVGDELKGTTFDLGRQLAASVGAPALMTGYGSLIPLMDAGSRGAWDVAVLAVEPGRLGLVDFVPPHLVATPSGERYAFAVPKGRPAAAEYLAKWVEAAKASGAVQRAIDAAGLGARARVAP